MRFKILAAGAALALITTVILSQAGAQTTGTIEVQQTDATVTIIAGGCDTGTVSFAMVVPNGSIETVNGTSIGSGRYSHVIQVNTTTPTGNYSVAGTCKTDTATLINYEQKAFAIGAAATPTPVASPTAVETGTATPVPSATAAPTATATTSSTMNLTASAQSIEIGKNAVITMTGCPGTQPAAGETYRATLQTTDPLGVTGSMNHDFTDSTTHEMVFATTGSTQPGNHTIVGLCEKKAGDAWAEVYRYNTVTIAVSGVATGSTPVPQTTATATATATAGPAPTAVPTATTAKAIGFTG